MNRTLMLALVEDSSVLESAEATFKKLKDGTWGLLVNSDSVKAGDEVATLTKAGKRETKVVGKVIWSGNGVSITSIATSGSSGSGSGSSSKGRSSYDDTLDLAAKGLVRVNGPRGMYVRKMTDWERHDYE